MRVRLAQREGSFRMSLFAWCLGGIALLDLWHYDVARAFTAGQNDFVYPYVALPQLADGAHAGPAFVLAQAAAMAGALLLLSGRLARAGAALLLGLYGYGFLSNRVAYTNNGFLLLLCLALVALAGPGVGRRALAFPRVMGRALFTIMYVTAALVKLEPDWLSGYLIGQAARHYHYAYSSLVAWYPPVLFRAVAWASIGIELFLGLAPWRPRLWRRAALVALGFHGAIELLLPVRLFSYLAIASFAFSMPPGIARRLRRRLPRSPQMRLLAGAALASALGWLTIGAGLYPRAPSAGAAWSMGLGAALLALWLDGRVRRRPRPAPLESLAIRARVGLVAAFVATLLALALKPAWGGSHQFAWRMFTQDVRLQVNLEVREATDDWRPEPSLFGAAHLWSSDGYQHHWSSLPEQREFLEHYARWLLRRKPGWRGVKLVVRSRVNRGAWVKDEIVALRPAAG